ncbi:MAG: hypothetical protein ABI867_24860 [Kofleriaceae bacterium]
MRVGLQSSITGERGKLAMIASCEAEPWPADVVRCFESARLEVDLTACTKKLTQEYYERLQTKLAALVQQPPPPMIDAGVALAPPVDAKIIDAPPVHVRIDAGTAVDCTRTIVNPSSSACRKQYCATHVDDLKCTVE